jgi:SHS2 domain-containing protein
MEKAPFKRYEYIDHTADLKIRAYGKTLEEAFTNCAIAGFDFLVDTSKVKRKIEKKIFKTSKRLEALLYDFLEELLFLLDTECFLFCDVKSMRIMKEEDECRLECVALGDNCKEYETHGDIKAITYSEMKIEEKKGSAMIQLVFDI